MSEEMVKFCVRLPRRMREMVRDRARSKGLRIERYVQRVIQVDLDRVRQTKQQSGSN